MQLKRLGLLGLGLLTWAALHSSIAEAAVSEIGKSGLYASLNDNALLVLVISFLGKQLFDLCRWVFIRFILGRQDATEASVKALSEKVDKALLELRDIAGKMPNETKIIDNLKPHVKLAVIEELRRQSN